MSVPQVQITARDFYVLTKGIPLDAAIALVSVLYHESHLNPGSQGYQSTEHGGILNPHGAYGIASWNGPKDQSRIGDPVYDRQAALLAYSKKFNLLVSALDTQLSFVITEIANGYPNVWAAIRSTASYQFIITILTDEYEIPANKTAEINDALAIAGPLAALPPPVAVPQAPLPQAPAPAPMPSPVPVGPPPLVISGLDAAILDHFGAILDALIKQRDAINVRIAKIQAQAEDFATLEGVETSLPPLLQKPFTATTKGTQDMPAIISLLFGNWKTTLSGVVAAAAQGVAATYPQYAPLAHWVSAAGVAALGATATDAKTK